MPKTRRNTKRQPTRKPDQRAAMRRAKVRAAGVNGAGRTDPERATAQRILDQMNAATPTPERSPEPRRKVSGRTVRAMCQFPFEEHVFEYVRTTKPRAYCDEHVLRDREVRVVRDDNGNVIGRRLIAEERVGEYERGVSDDPTSIIGALRQEAARAFHALGLPMPGTLWLDRKAGPPLTPGKHYPAEVGARWFGRFFKWREVERHVSEPGSRGHIEATTSVLVMDAVGPQYDPALYRSLTTEEHVVAGPSAALSLDMDMTDSEDPFTLADIELVPAEPAPGIAEMPVERPLIPEALRRLHVAFGVIALKMRGGQRAYSEHLVREARVTNPAQAAAIEREVAAAIQQAKWDQMVAAGRRETPVLTSGSTPNDSTGR